MLWSLVSQGPPPTHPHIPPPLRSNQVSMQCTISSVTTDVHDVWPVFSYFLIIQYMDTMGLKSFTKSHLNSVREKKICTLKAATKLEGPKFFARCTKNGVFFPGDHSYITSLHFCDFWTPLPPYVSMFLVLRISKNWHFLTPPLPLPVLT